MRSKHFLLVAGNIGAGKTSLVERLGARLGWQTGYESVSDNPYLADFYQDMARWAFHLQVFFIGHRAQQHRQLHQLPQSAIADRSIYEDAYIFARALHHMGALSQRDYDAYRRTFDQITAVLPKPDLLLYLKCPVPHLMARIQQRGRAIENSIDADYLGLLESFYDDWIQNFDLCPVLVIPSERLDYVNHPHHLDIVIDHIQAKLAGKEAVIFPQ